VATITATQATGQKVLSGTTPDIVTLAVGGTFDVCNWVGAADLTVSFAMGNNTARTPAAAGEAETYVVPASTARTFFAESSPAHLVILGNGNTYSVDGRPR
jgi:hypothetical protein